MKLFIAHLSFWLSGHPIQQEIVSVVLQAENYGAIPRVGSLALDHCTVSKWRQDQIKYHVVATFVSHITPTAFNLRTLFIMTTPRKGGACY